jgi:hypothetical protein
VQSQFNGRLVDRRKLYPAPLRRVLRDTIEVRDKADYTTSSVSDRVARRVLQEAEDFVRGDVLDLVNPELDDLLVKEDIAIYVRAVGKS